MNKHKKFIKEAYEGKHGSICQEWKDTILRHYPEFKEEEFKVGDWIVITENYSHLEKGAVCRIRNWQFEKNQWPLVDQHPFSAPFRSHYRKATKEEIQQHLIKEAERRGYKEGVVVKSFVHNMDLKIEGVFRHTTHYIQEYDKLHFGGCGNKCVVVYEKGQWAEIIKTITKEEAEKKLGMKII